jgi:predicted kinase
LIVKLGIGSTVFRCCCNTGVVLIVFGGLPGVGKTVLSRPIAGRLAMAWLRVDAIEAAMWRAGLPPGEGTGLGSYVVANSIAGAQLSLGLGVVADAVNPVEAARRGWRDLATEHGVPLRVIEVVCSDQAEHRRRVQQRQPQPDQPAIPSWDEVLARQYESWQEPRLTVDTVLGVARCVEGILAYCAIDAARG